MRFSAESEYKALRTEAFLRNGNERVPLSDLLSRVTWKECSQERVDLCTLREDVVTAVTDFIVLHRKNVNLDELCKRIVITKKNGKVSIQLPSEVIAWLQIQ